MLTIHKYNIQITDRQVLRAPARAMFLTAQPQMGKVCLWAVVDPSAPMNDYDIRIYGTGHKILAPVKGHHSGFGTGPRLPYIGTAQVEELVWHVFVSE